jgi:hypothetical protein
MTPAVRLLAAALLAAAASLSLAASAAHADGPAATGWWTATNPGSVLGSPAPPPPPDVPADGLLIEGGADGTPTAFAAAVYELPDGSAPVTLTLAVAPSSATTPAATLELCPLTSAVIVREHGGPMADAPTYRCARKVTASPSPDGTQYAFNVASWGADGSVAVAVLPTAQTDRVVLKAPDTTSLRTAPASTSGSVSPGSTDSVTGAGPAVEAPESAPSGVAVDGPASAPMALGPATISSSPAAQGPSVAGPVAPVPPTGGFTPSAFTPAASSRSRPLAVALAIVLVLSGLGLWEAAGRAATRDRLLGSQQEVQQAMTLSLPGPS